MIVGPLSVFLLAGCGPDKEKVLGKYFIAAEESLFEAPLAVAYERNRQCLFEAEKLESQGGFKRANADEIIEGIEINLAAISRMLGRPRDEMFYQELAIARLARTDAVRTESETEKTKALVEQKEKIMIAIITAAHAGKYHVIPKAR